jgi:hydroxypyruvate reductase
LVDSGTVQRGNTQNLDAVACLQTADAGTFLAASGDLIHTGPTGTNVMDVVIGWKVS